MYCNRNDYEKRRAVRHRKQQNPLRDRMNDGTQKSAGQNTGTNRIAILEEKPEAEKNRGFTAGTLQEDLKLSSEEVRDDEHLRCNVKALYIIAPHKPNCT